MLGATPGKMLMRVRVVSRRTARVPGPGRGLVRFLMPLVIGVVLGMIPLTAPLVPFAAVLVYASCAFDPSGARQGWHDRAARTIVVTQRAPAV